MKNSILITGCAGFIGFHLTELLCHNGYNVVGIDNLNSYYDRTLKEDRLKILEKNKNFTFHKLDLLNISALNNLFKNNQFTALINLAAQAGVRYSFENPQAYIDSNITGFTNILELGKKYNIKLVLYASSSSVYGECNEFPYSEKNYKIKPISLYGVTKKFNEDLAYSYNKLFKMNCIGLRFFTVYGPWGRPDMALFKFVKNIKNNKSIDVYNNGKHHRSFTYISDITDAIKLLLEKYINENISINEVLNIGGDKSINLLDFIKIIEQKLGLKAKINYLPKQLGDIEKTESDCSKIQSLVAYSPKISIDLGIQNFISWYNKYYYKI